MAKVDLLIRARWVLPVEPANACLRDHAIAVSDGAIVGLLPIRDADHQFEACSIVDLPSHVVMPGLVNLHVHAAMTLMRGLADDLPLMRWLHEAIWPAEQKHVSHAFVRDGSLLAACEMLAGGVTTCNDMYFHPDAAAEAFDHAGIRAVIGMVVIDFPTPYAADADTCFRRGLAARDHWKGHPLLGFALAPHAPYTVTDESLIRCSSVANELDIPLHIHVHETCREVADSLARHGKRPLARLHELGLLGPSLIAVHAIHMDPNEIAALAHHGCSVAHCPTSNMKLASGAAPVVEMLKAGIPVGLGSDGAASNNRLDLFQEMRLAALLAKLTTEDAVALPAHQAVRMATLDGARALKLDRVIGSIETGKRADLCAVSLAAFETQPCFDPASHLVYVAGREHVTHVWVDGNARVLEGRLLRNCNSDLVTLTTLWQNEIGINEVARSAN